MLVSAHPRSQLLSQLRSGFVQQPTGVLGFVTPSTATTAVPLVAPVEPPTPDVQTPTTDNFFSTNEQLDVVEKVMAEVMAAKQTAVSPAGQSPTAPPSKPPTDQFASLMPQMLDQNIQAAQQQAQPTVGSTVRKEVAPNQVVPETPFVVPETPQVTEQPLENVPNPTEAGASAPYQEVEQAAPEISPEVEAYLQEIKTHQEQLPHEIVIANNDVQLTQPQPPLRPMIVLPITPEVEQAGEKKPPTMSVRWLVEWSRRLMKMFSGKIIYQEPEKGASA